MRLHDVALLVVAHGEDGGDGHLPLVLQLPSLELGQLLLKLPGKFIITLVLYIYCPFYVLCVKHINLHKVSDFHTAQVALCSRHIAILCTTSNLSLMALSSRLRLLLQKIQNMSAIVSRRLVPRMAGTSVRSSSWPEPAAASV